MQEYHTRNEGALKPTDVHVWGWTFDTPGPPITRSVPVGEALRGGVTFLHDQLGYGLLPASVHRDESTPNGHARWLSYDEDGDGCVDSAWVCAEAGFPMSFIAALASLRFIKVDGMRFDLTPAVMGPFVPGGVFGPAMHWKAVTPYVAPLRHTSKTGKERPAYAAEAQIRREIAARNLPEPIAIDLPSFRVVGNARVEPSAFELRRRGAAPPPEARTGFPEIVFREAVAGPVSLGYGASFGLGLLVPAEFV